MRPPSELDVAAKALRSGANGADVWAALQAAHCGDARGLRALLTKFPDLHRADCHGTGLLQLAVCEGSADVVALLLDAGADPLRRSARGDSLVRIAIDRGHDEIAKLLDSARQQVVTDAPVLDDRVHPLAAQGEPGALASERDRCTSSAYSPIGFESIDLALWSTPFWNLRGDEVKARNLISAGASYDIVIAAALGDHSRVVELLDRDPSAVDEPRPSGKRALSAAVEFEHDDIAELLLERGADPNASEGPYAPLGSALHAAARRGAERIVESLLAHGADPNSYIDSSGSATYAAKSRGLRERLIAAGGVLTPYDLVWLGEDECVLESIIAEPETAHLGCGTVFAAVCTLERRDLLSKLLAAGAPVPKNVDGCRSYLLEQPDMLRDLLACGMDANLPDWQGATLLHELCSRDLRGRPRAARIEAATILLDAGADPYARDQEYASTPLAWAARSGLLDMVEYLLTRGVSPTEHAGEPWSTPLAWAKRRGHAEIVARLQAADSGA